MLGPGRLYINNFAEPKVWSELKMAAYISALEGLHRGGLGNWMKSPGVEELETQHPVSHPAVGSKTSRIYF